MTDLDRVVSLARKRQGYDTRVGFLGRGTGEPRNHNRPGEMWVRIQLAEGALSAPVSMAVAPNANLRIADGFTVEIGLAPNGREEIILGAYLPGIQASGGNALSLNPLDVATNKAVDSTQLTTFYCDRHPDIANKPFTVIVYPAITVVNDVIQIFPSDDSASEIDLTSLQPSTGEYVWAVVFWTVANSLEALASTARTIGDPAVKATLLQEAYDQRTADSVPIWAWYLTGDMTELSQDKTMNLDCRQLFNMPITASAGGSSILPIKRSWFGI